MMHDLVILLVVLVGHFRGCLLGDCPEDSRSSSLGLA